MATAERDSIVYMPHVELCACGNIIWRRVGAQEVDSKCTRCLRAEPDGESPVPAQGSGTGAPMETDEFAAAGQQDEVAPDGETTYIEALVSEVLDTSPGSYDTADEVTAERKLAETESCPFCRSMAGEPCKSASGAPRLYAKPHSQRLEKARRNLAGEPAQVALF